MKLSQCDIWAGYHRSFNDFVETNGKRIAQEELPDDANSLRGLILCKSRMIFGDLGCDVEGKLVDEILGRLLYAAAYQRRVLNHRQGATGVYRDDAYARHRVAIGTKDDGSDMELM